MSYVLYAGLAVLVIWAIWFGVRFVREYRAVSRYMRRTKASGRMKSEIRRHRRALKQSRE
jgi:hypothetical protein